MQALLVPYCVLGLIAVVKNGGGKHQWNVTMVQLAHFGSVGSDRQCQILED